jgi:hypothetical protein
MGRRGRIAGGVGLGGWPVDPRICKRTTLSETTRAYCDRIAGLRGRDLFKAMALENLRRPNHPPVADLQPARGSEPPRGAVRPLRPCLACRNDAWRASGVGVARTSIKTTNEGQ